MDSTPDIVEPDDTFDETMGFEGDGPPSNPMPCNPYPLTKPPLHSSMPQHVPNPQKSKWRPIPPPPQKSRPAQDDFPSIDEDDFDSAAFNRVCSELVIKNEAELTAERKRIAGKRTDARRKAAKSKSGPGDASVPIKALEGLTVDNALKSLGKDPVTKASVPVLTLRYRLTAPEFKVVSDSFPEYNIVNGQRSNLFALPYSIAYLSDAHFCDPHYRCDHVASTYLLMLPPVGRSEYLGRRYYNCGGSSFQMQHDGATIVLPMRSMSGGHTIRVWGGIFYECQTGAKKDRNEDLIDVSIRNEIFNVCCQAFMTKSLSSSADYKIVYRRAVQIAKSHNLMSLCTSFNEYLSGIVREAFEEALHIREEEIKQLRQTAGYRQATRDDEEYRAKHGYYPQPWASTKHNRVSRLEEDESKPKYEPWILGRPITCMQRLQLGLLILFYIILLPVLEETAKLFTTTRYLDHYFGISGGLSFLAPWVICTIFASIEHSRGNDRNIGFLVRLGGHLITAYLFGKPQYDYDGLSLQLRHNYFNIAIVCSIHMAWNLLCHFTGRWEFCMRIIYCEKHAICLDRYLYVKPPMQANYKVQEPEQHCKPTFGWRTFMQFGSWHPTVFATCTHNEERSLDGRVGKKLPKHDDPGVETAWQPVIARHLMYFLHRIRRVNVPIRFSDWVSAFPPKRREELIKVRNELDYPQFVGAKSFVKREKANKHVENYSFKDPRMIQGCPLEMSAACGPFVRRLAKNVVTGLHPRNGGNFYYTCGSTNVDIGESLCDAIDRVSCGMDPTDKLVFIEDDQSRFDMHIGEGGFNFLDHIYRNKLPKRIANKLRRGVSTGTTMRGHRYSVPYTMQSGWPDTSCGDTLVNCLLKLHAHRGPGPWLSIVCGDDSVTVMRQSHLNLLGGVPGIQRAYEQLGMETTIKLSYNVMDIEFCSGRFYLTKDDSYVLMPKPGRLLARMYTDITDRSTDDQLAWLRSVNATCLKYGETDPLYSFLGQNVSAQLGMGRMLTLYEHEYKQRIAKADSDFYHYYDHHYSFSVDDYNTLCRVLSKAKLGTRVVHPLLDAVLAHDN